MPAGLRRNDAERSQQVLMEGHIITFGQVTTPYDIHCVMLLMAHLL
jgi:hypothetical protein